MAIIIPVNLCIFTSFYNQFSLTMQNKMKFQLEIAQFNRTADSETWLLNWFDTTTTTKLMLILGCFLKHINME